MSRPATPAGNGPNRAVCSAHRNIKTGATQTQHPLDAYLVELLARRRAEVAARTPVVGVKSMLSQKRISVLEVRGPAHALMLPCPAPCSLPAAVLL